MRLAVLIACALLATGCGVLDDEGPALSQGPDPAVYGPREAVPRATPPIPLPELQPPSHRVASQLDAGAIGVVDIAGAVAVRPQALETARDATLESLEWERWDASGAEGRGELRVRECQPSCANGHTETLAATIMLRGVRSCRGRRYFEAAEVRVQSGEPPASYVRAPC